MRGVPRWRPLPRALAASHVTYFWRSLVMVTFRRRQSPGSLLWFRLLHRGLPGALLCAALGKPGRSSTRVTALAHERPRRAVIGHVLLRGHAQRCARPRREP